MVLRGLALTLLLVLAPLRLAWRQEDPDRRTQGEAKTAGGCEAPSDWDPNLRFTPNQRSYALNDLVQLSCAGKYVPSVPQIRCISNRTQISWNGTATCEETCQMPVWWDPRLQRAPDHGNYKKNEEVTLSCNNGFQPSFTRVTCAEVYQTLNFSGSVERYVWLGRESSGAWIPIEENVVCIETCQRPHWGQGLQLVPDQEKYKKNEEVILSCPHGFQASLTHVKCTGRVLSISNGKRVYREAWYGRDSKGMWTSIHPMFNVCFEKCQKPQWDPRFVFDKEQETFNPKEMVEMRCPEGHWPSSLEMKCMKLSSSQGNIPSSGWFVKNVTGLWHHVEGKLTCVEVLQVVPGTLEISSTSIKLKWTCKFPDFCQDIWARCQLAVLSSSPCEAEDMKREEKLHGQEGTFTCQPLQPFTLYSVTILLPPSTILYTRLRRTKEVVPDKPEKLWLDPNTGSFRWKALPSCKGEIIGYQINITARKAHDGSFFEFKQVLVNQSVTQYTPPHQTPGSKYTVTVQGITVAGAGAASLLEFQTHISVSGQSLGFWPGSAVTVVVLVLVLVPVSAGILWFVLSRKKKALPSKAEEDHYRELQLYENTDDYCVMKGISLTETGAGKAGQAGELLTRPLPVLESPGDIQSTEGEEKTEWTSEAQC